MTYKPTKPKPSRKLSTAARKAMAKKRPDKAALAALQRAREKGVMV